MVEDEEFWTSVLVNFWSLQYSYSLQFFSLLSYILSLDVNVLSLITVCDRLLPDLLFTIYGLSLDAFQQIIKAGLCAAGWALHLACIFWPT